MSATLFSHTRTSNLRLSVQQPAIPQFRELLTQGVLAGSFALFIYAIVCSFFIDNYYKLLICRAVHECVGIGAVTGLAHGLIYWCYARLFQARFRQTARLLTSVVTVAVSYAVLSFLYPSDQSVNEQSPNVPLLTSWIGVQLISFSVITGSHWRPWRALIYGVSRVNSHQRLPASAIGLLLRVTLLSLCLESIFFLICMLQMNGELKNFVIMWLIVADFVIGLVIALVNPRFWLALSLAIMINGPWIYLSLMYPNEASRANVFLGGYLLLWCAYLVTRWRRLDPLFAYIREELRYYYLVD
jgi:hypothetical protein